MITSLYLFTLVGIWSRPYSETPYYDWRYMGEYATPSDCNHAVQMLAVKPEKARCVPTGKKLTEKK